jgi:hypothetical protein
MQETRRSSSFRQRALLVGVAVAALAALSTLVILWPHGSCDGIFRQTAPKLEAHLEIIKQKGALAVSQEQIQVLSESAQKVGLHLKTCCSVLDRGKLDPKQFQQCIDKASAYDRQIAFAAQQVTEAAEARERGASAIVQEKIPTIDQAIRTATSDAENFARQVAQIKPLNTSTEHEPNDTILQANPFVVGDAVIAEVSDTKDQDYFKFRYTPQLRDKVIVTLENRSTTLRPWVKVYDKNKSEILNHYNDTYGANLEFTLSMEPESDYYLQVLPYDSSGQYHLTVVAQQAFDRYEPNDDSFSATVIEIGQVIAANIMDHKDTDWYQLTAISSEEVTLRMENRSTTLRPWVKVYDKNKSEILNHYNDTYGADLEFAFKAEPGSSYYVRILSYDSHGEYQLSVR